MVLRQTIPLFSGIWSIVIIKQNILRSFEKILCLISTKNKSVICFKSSYKQVLLDNK